MTRNRKLQFALIFLVLASGLFYAATFREGHYWTGGFAQYLQHAGQLAHGEPYVLTGVKVSRLITPSPYPVAYPPVYSCVLVPFQALFGTDLERIKLVNLVFFIPALLLTGWLFRRRLTPGSLLAVVALVTLNPNCWKMKDVILSDICYFFFAYAALLALRSVGEAEARSSWGRFGFLAAGGLAYLAFATRTAGIVILPAAILHDLIRFRRVRAATIASALTAAAAVTVQFSLMPRGAGYLAWIAEVDPQVFLFNLLVRLRSFVGLWGPEDPTIFSVCAAALIGAALLFHFLRRLFKGPDLIDLFFGLSLVVLLVYPGGTLRYLVPLLPILLLYLFEGLDELFSGGRPQQVARVLLILLLLTSFASGYSRLDLRAIPDGVTAPESRELFAHIRATTGEQEVIVTMQPRIVHFYTGRTAAPYYRPFEDWFSHWAIERGDRGATEVDHVWRLEAMREVGAGYLLWSDLFDYDRTILSDLLIRYPEHFTKVYQTDHFRFYRINRLP